MSKVAVVTGAARGIGLATAKKFLFEGWRVALLDIDGATQARANTALNQPNDTLAIECDVSGAVQRSLDDSYRYAQFRVRLDQAGDRDGDQDLVAFFKSDSNTNEPGIFLLNVTVLPD